MDNMLDIVIRLDMTRWEWKDADEFSEAQKAGFYSSEKAAAIRAEGEKALSLITSERRPFYKDWKNWKVNPKWEIPKLSPLWDKVDFEKHSAQNGV